MPGAEEVTWPLTALAVVATPAFGAVLVGFPRPGRRTASHWRRRRPVRPLHVDLVNLRQLGCLADLDADGLDGRALAAIERLRHRLLARLTAQATVYRAALSGACSARTHFAGIARSIRAPAGGVRPA